MSSSINSRPAAPIRAYTPGPPDTESFAIKQISKQQRSNFHSTSLRSQVPIMVANNVNKTALHPRGVEYVVSVETARTFSLTLVSGHKLSTLRSRLSSTTRLTSTGIALQSCVARQLMSYSADTTQIANPSVPALYEDALVYETGSAITSSGALSAYSGAKTGRSPSDKRVVEEDSSKNDIWWVSSIEISHLLSSLLILL